MRLAFAALSFLCVLPQLAQGAATQPAWQTIAGGQLILRPFRCAAYPHLSRADGFKGRATTYPVSPHYTDSTVGLFIPPHYRGGESVDCVVYFHGHNNHVSKVIPQYRLAEQFADAKVNSILIVPQGPKDAADSGGGKLELDNGGFERLIDEITQFLKADGKIQTTKVGRIALASHSGGYRVTAAILDRGGLKDHITDVLLLDSSYGSLENFATWAAASPSHRLVSLYTQHLAAANKELMDLMEAAKVDYAVLDEATGADGELGRRGTTFMATKVPHDEVPLVYFGRLVSFMAVTVYPGNALAAAPEPTGASLAWTSQDEAVMRARLLLKDGEWTRAEAEVKASFDSPAQREMLEIIARLRREYSLSADDLAAKLQESLPGTSGTDIERWRAAGGVQWRMIDGKPAFFRREPANLFRFCDEPKQRLGTPIEPLDTDWSLGHHLQEILAEADRTGMEQVLPIQHRVTHTLTVPATAPGMKVGAVVRAWLPFPQEHDRQRGVRLIASSPQGAVVAPLDSPQRSIYFELSVKDPAKPLIFSETFEFTSLAFYPKLDDAAALPLPASFAGGNVGERAPHIVFTPSLRKAVAEAVGEATNPLARARLIYHWVADHIAYCAEEEYGVIPSLSEKALATRRGDCGVQSMLFIAMCRCAGIPARWQSGWETKPVGWDMHDWAEFYVEPWGWLPADPSYGPQKSDDPRIREFYFGHQDSYRLIVNRDYGSPLHPSKHSLRSDPVDFQRGEVEIDGRNLYFSQWSHDVKFEWKSGF